MIDVKFNEAMEPLEDALRRSFANAPTIQGPRNDDRNAAAAVVEALGIPAWMVADPAFRRGLEVVVGVVKATAPSTLPPIRADEPEAITEPGLPSFIPDPPACAGPTDNAT